MPHFRPLLVLALTASLAAATVAGCNSQTTTQGSSEDEDHGHNSAIDEALAHRLPGQGHAMTDVEYHFSNLWFAGQARNWPLAKFYLHETEEGMEWAVDIRPVRPDDEGNNIDLEAIFQGVENSTLPPLHEAIAAGDAEAFATGYHQLMEACHSCHVACDKPYIRPQIPEHPPAAGIDFSPAPAGE